MSYFYLRNQNLPANILMFDLQTWHIPNRVHGVKPRPVMDVTVQKLQNPKLSAQVKKKRKVSGVTSTVYKPFEEPIWSLDLPEILSPILEGLKPKPGFLRVWPDDDEDVLLTESKYGLVPKGSVFPTNSPLQVKRLQLQQTSVFLCLTFSFQFLPTLQLYCLRNNNCTMTP